MTPRVLVLNGPNLNLLGVREPEIYGRETLADVEARLHARAGALGLAVECRQSNAEHLLIEAIHAWVRGGPEAAAIIVNPAAYTHTSVAIRDALAAFPGPVVEVHLSNVHAREAFRHRSYVSGVATAVIAGCGTHGYLLALDHVASLLS